MNYSTAFYQINAILELELNAQSRLEFKTFLLELPNGLKKSSAIQKTYSMMIS